MWFDIITVKTASRKVHTVQIEMSFAYLRRRGRSRISPSIRIASILVCSCISLQPPRRFVGREDVEEAEVFAWRLTKEWLCVSHNQYRICDNLPTSSRSSSPSTSPYSIQLRISALSKSPLPRQQNEQRWHIVRLFQQINRGGTRHRYGRRSRNIALQSNSQSYWCYKYANFYSKLRMRQPKPFQLSEKITEIEVRV